MQNYSGIDNNLPMIKEMLAQGDSAYAISKKTVYSKPTILRCIHRYGLKNTHSSKCDPNNLLKDKLDQIITLYTQGHSVYDISRLIGHSDVHVLALLRKHNIKINDHRYHVDEQFFDNINCEANAYVLGWLYNGGHITNSKLRIQVRVEDKYILEYIVDLMKYSGPLYYVDPPKQFPYRKQQVILCISRKVLVEQLKKLGCIQNKSFIISFPSKEIVPDIVLNHFVRGLLDGGKRKLETSQFVDGLINRIDSLGIQNFYSWLYKDATIYLKRKKHEGNTSRYYSTSSFWYFR